MSKLPMASLLSLVVGCGGGAGSPPPTPSPTDSATVPTSPTGTSTPAPTASTGDTGRASPTGDTAVASSATTADTSTTQITSATATTADTASTSTASTGMTGDTGLECDAIPFGPTCYMEDGLCYAPDLAWTDSLLDYYLDYVVDQTQSGCGAVVATTCSDGAVVLARWHKWSETGDVDVYDGTTREWVAGYIITDDPYEKCGEEVWIGDPAYQECGHQAFLQMYAAFAGGCGYYTEDASGACTVLDPACVIDEVKRP